MENLIESENYDYKKIIVKKNKSKNANYKEYDIELADFSLIKCLLGILLKLLGTFFIGYFLYDSQIGSILATLLAIYFLFCLNSTVRKINVMVVPSVGVQERVITALGRTKLNLYKFEKIKGIILNEHISWCEVTFYMCLIYNSVGNQDNNIQNESLKPLFLAIRPKHDTLKLIYKDLQPTIKESIINE